VGSALTSLLSKREIPVKAVDDGRTGFITAVDFDVVLEEVNVAEEGVLGSVLGRGHAGEPPPDTVFVDMDPSTPVAPYKTPLACLLAVPQLGVASLGYKRVVFLGSDSSLRPGAAKALTDLLDGCLVGDGAEAALAELALNRLKENLQNDAGTASAASVTATTTAPPPAVLLVTWEDAVILGPGIDVMRVGADEKDPLFSALRCIADSADSTPYDKHNFELGPLLDTFFEHTVSSNCSLLVALSSARALAKGLHSGNAAGDALNAALSVSTIPPSPPSVVSVFERVLGTEPTGFALLPQPSITDGAILRNSLPSLSSFAPADKWRTLHSLLFPPPPAKSLKDNTTDSPKLQPNTLIDTLWWVWRQGIIHGFRDPEPHPSYDPETSVSGPEHGSKYTIHSLATYGVSHGSGHVKMRYSAVTWGWRFKRGGIPWSSTKGDEIVPVKVVEPRQGSPYHLLALRTIAVWKWVVATYPTAAWYIRMWDDVFPVVERYLDIARSHDGGGKLAVGRVIGKRQAYLSGGPPGLFSKGWADILRETYGDAGLSGADTCLRLFEAWKGEPAELPTLRGRGVGAQNEILSRRFVETHCDLGCEDLVIEWCMRDVLGGYYELVHWWGLDALAPSTINDKGLYECKAMACRRRVMPRGDMSDNNPIHMVVFHYVKPWEMVKAEGELYGGYPAGSPEWVKMCEDAQARPDCQEEVVSMPLPEPWLTGGSLAPI